MGAWLERMAVVALLGGALAMGVGCSSPMEGIGTRTAENSATCGGEECHEPVVVAAGTGAHSSLECVTCHEGTGTDHAADPASAKAQIDWRIDACSGCHEDEAVTYLYDDNTKVGPFGGSQRKPPQPKLDTFPKYNSIVAGHGFTREYNEEGAHAFMLEDHYETARGKFETCVQCKSTKLAYAWDTDKALTVESQTEIELTHTRAPGVDARKVVIPAGTEITYATDPDSRAVDAKATFPDGTVWSANPPKSEDATQHYNMVWASTIAAIKETLPYGAGCNHCHDPHTGGERLVRKAMLDAIEGDGGPNGTGGVNPYIEGSPKEWQKASKKDRLTLMCAQCHVEYTCGKSGVDGVDRDAFGWAKATDLHDLYLNQFDYAQDWKHALIGEPLIKSQHPETELYWQSTHYDAGASCADCHMPEVRGADNRTFRSHWFTSPYKYRDQVTWKAFAESTGVDPASDGNPCALCHADRTEEGIAQQQAFYARQAQVEELLAQSVTRFERLKGAKPTGRVNEAAYSAALDAHRRAHVIWENLAVSENSMGFHNFDEAMDSMAEAERQVRTALAKAEEAHPTE